MPTLKIRSFYLRPLVIRSGSVNQKQYYALHNILWFLMALNRKSHSPRPEIIDTEAFNIALYSQATQTKVFTLSYESKYFPAFQGNVTKKVNLFWLPLIVKVMTVHKE